MTVYKLRTKQDKIVLNEEFFSREEAEASAAYAVLNHPGLDWHKVYEGVEKYLASEADVDPAAARVWAERHGYDVPPRGRVKQDIVDKYIMERKKRIRG